MARYKPSPEICDHCSYTAFAFQQPRGQVSIREAKVFTSDYIIVDQIKKRTAREKSFWMILEA